MLPGPSILRLAAVIHTLLIFALVPLGRPLQKFIGHLSCFAVLADEKRIPAASRAGIICAALYAAIVLGKAGAASLLKHALLAAVILALLLQRGFFAWVEAVHIPIFALLAALVYLSWGRNILLTLLIAACVGALDEVLQGLHPQRVFDPYDIWLNFLSSALGLVLIHPLCSRSGITTEQTSGPASKTAGRA